MIECQKDSSGIITGMFVLLLLPFMSIAGITQVVGTVISQTWQTAAMLILMLFVIFRVRYIRLNWPTILFTVYQALIWCSSTWHHRFSFGITVVTMEVTLLFLVLQSQYYREVLEAVSLIVAASVLINFPIMLPNTGDQHMVFFIGGKNALGIFLIPGALLFLISIFEKQEKITNRAIAVLILCFLTVFLGASGTGVVVAAYAVLLLLIARRYKPNKKLYLIAIFTVYVLFLLFAEAFTSSQLWLVITRFLGKDATLTSRTIIWSSVWKIIQENWLFGSGRGTQIQHLSSWGGSIIRTEAHNFILEILMEGGIVGLALYGTMFMKSVNRLNMTIPKHQIVFIALCVLLINGLTESTVNNLFVTIILGIACRYAATEAGYDAKPMHRSLPHETDKAPAHR